MKVLTVHQPWADLIVSGQKRFENRSRPTKYRGPVAILAGLSRKSLSKMPRVVGAVPGFPFPTVFGAIIGVVDIVDCHSTVPDDPFACGPFCWELANPVLLPEPIPKRGCLGLVSLPPETRQLIESALGNLQPA